jgi:hypothetical protein
LDWEGIRKLLRSVEDLTEQQNRLFASAGVADGRSQIDSKRRAISRTHPDTSTTFRPIFVFRDRAMLNPVALSQLSREFTDPCMVIIGDAGAARGRLDPQSVNRTARALETLRSVTRRIAWLNPVPVDRWFGTTAEAVRRECSQPMFPIDRAGLDAAVSILQGRQA